MKAVRNVLRVLAGLLAVGTVVLFFFNFAEVTFSETTNVLKLTGAELAFGADVTSRFADAGKELVTFKSGWYFLAFFAAAFTAVFSLLGLKSKGSSVASLITGLFGGITSLVVLLDNPIGYIDTGRLDTIYTASGVSFSVLAFVAAGAFFATVAANIAWLLVDDKILVNASKGARLSIFGKIGRFFKDYRSELKKIVWPSFRTVVKNTVVVLVMCLIVGIFIWLVDWGLSEGLKALFANNNSSSSSTDYNLTTSSQVVSDTSETSLAESSLTESAS